MECNKVQWGSFGLDGFELAAPRACRNRASFSLGSVVVEQGGGPGGHLDWGNVPIAYCF